MTITQLKASLRSEASSDRAKKKSLRVNLDGKSFALRTLLIFNYSFASLVCRHLESPFCFRLRRIVL
jgi:hypothetical protein